MTAIFAVIEKDINPKVFGVKEQEISQNQQSKTVIPSRKIYYINYNIFWVIIASFNRLRLIRNSRFSKLTMTVSKEEVIKQIFFCLDIREVEF